MMEAMARTERESYRRGVYEIAHCLRQAGSVTGRGLKRQWLQ